MYVKCWFGHFEDIERSRTTGRLPGANQKKIKQIQIGSLIRSKADNLLLVQISNSSKKDRKKSIEPHRNFDRINNSNNKKPTDTNFTVELYYKF